MGELAGMLGRLWPALLSWGRREWLGGGCLRVVSRMAVWLGGVNGLVLVEVLGLVKVSVLRRKRRSGRRSVSGGGWVSGTGGCMEV